MANHLRSTKIDYSTVMPSIDNRRVQPNNPFIEFNKDEIEQSIPARFDQIVAKYPDRLAVKTNDQELTYRGLNRLSNRMAHAILAQQGEGQEPIALLLGYSAQTIAAILGVLKAGKTYVPIDPRIPWSRKQFILQDLDKCLVVTNSRYLATVIDPVRRNTQFLNIDETDSGFSPENPKLKITPESAAWIIYTSGSTGHPKGVIQTHRTANHFVMNFTNGYHIASDDRFCFLYSFSVSPAARQIFGALLNGASIFPYNINREGFSGLANWLVENEIIFYSSVPTIFRYFVETLTGDESFPSLRLIKMVGEPVYRRDLDLYKKHFSSDCILVNCFGSTETGITLSNFIDKQTKIYGNHVPVGYPVQDKEITLEGEDGQEVRPGEVGEIVVKSHFLSKGYWRNPDLTEAALYPEPAGSGAGIYRTGDLGQLLPDGALISLGRKDSQVKVRGFRIEPIEMEMALLRSDLVKEADIQALRNDSGEQRLVAYIIPAVERPITVSELRNFLAEQLPDYMIPFSFVVIEAFPLTPSGKIDRQSLPDPGYDRPFLDVPFIEPRTSTEEALAKIWSNVLALEQVGIHDPFLELGGDSMRATQVITRVLRQFKIDVPLHTFFETATVAAMAEIILNHMADGVDDKEMALLLTEIEDLSDEEVQQRLVDQDD